MKLKKLTLTNFRSFDNFTIDFDENLTVIVAENGVGKTSVLDAVTIALGQFIGGFDTGKDSGFSANDAKLNILKSKTTQTVNMESSYPVTLVAEGEVDRQDIKWSRALSGAKSKTTYGKATLLKEYAKRLQEQVRDETDPSLPIISYYGTGRLWHQKQTAKGNSSRLFGYDKALEPASTYKEFAKWFEEESKAEYNTLLKLFQKEGNIDFSLLDKSMALDKIREAVNRCLSISEWQDIRYDYEFKKITVTHPKQGTLPIERLSDGVRSMLAMTADIAYRCVTLNPHLADAPKETEGIVLIDEIELHLHPDWQQVVIPNFQEAFPKIQFIITTHSPQVLSAIKNDAIRIISESQVYLAPLGTEGAEASRILQRVFGVKLRAPQNSITIKLNQYLDLVYDDKWEEALNLREELDNIFGGEEPALVEADLYIENRKWEMEIEEDS